jgi:hypothetical protein
MTEETQARKRTHKRIWLALAALVVLVAVLIVPPLVSVSRYKRSITQLISASLGRPVRLSSVNVRLLPRPGFVLTDLTVDEDPAYGAEPVLHANTVTAYIRLLSLWRGRLEIGTVSVDEASLNLVRTSGGRWNLDPLLRTAAAKAAPGPGGAEPYRQINLPFLEATNSRINIKNGAEKLPFSLVGAEISFWQQNPGDWRVRLRGQPARTDLSLDLADTGMVRLEASLRQAAQLRLVPVHLDLEWRDAQLGQLTRLVLGSDSGWRGDLTGELHLDGTAEAAQVKTRLRATGVHRSEFAPAAPLDFDANCGFVSHFSRWAIDKLVCDSPLGNGHVRLSGDLPGEGGQPHFSVELDRIPAAAGLDALRTVRNDFGPGLEASGTASGKITYAAADVDPDADRDAGQHTPKKPAHPGKSRLAKTHPAVKGPLTGSIAIEGFQLSGDGLSTPLQAPKLLLEPVAAPGNQPQALTATVAIPSGGVGPLTITARLALAGYQLTVRGQSSITRARELAHVAGLKNVSALDALAGEPITVDLSAEGPWMPAPRLAFGDTLPGAATAPGVSPAVVATATDSLTGTVTLHNANWKADYLANHVEISQATLHLNPGEILWDPVAFSYGPVKGTASLSLPVQCAAPEPCPAHFQVQFGDLDADLFQAAFLGAREKGTLLSTLIARLRPTAAPAWPRLEGTVKADSLLLGPVTLRQVTATLRFLESGAEIAGLDAGLLGGHVHGAGTFHTAGSAQDKPTYALQAQFEKLSPPAVGQLLGQRWSGGVFDGNGKIELSGFTGKDLAASAKGAVHFEWRHGAVGAARGPESVPPALARFDRWTADADVAGGSVTLKQNQVQRGGRTAEVQAAATLSDPAKVVFVTPKETRAKR